MSAVTSLRRSRKKAQSLSVKNLGQDERIIAD
jgi:hypothetical protein